MTPTIRVHFQYILRIVPLCCVISAGEALQARPPTTDEGACALSFAPGWSEDAAPTVTVSRPFLRVLSLTRQEYVAMAVADQLLPTDFVVVDDLPAEMAPQLVAGFLSRNPVPPLSHLAMFAEKMGIPIVRDSDGSIRSDLTKIGPLEAPRILTVDPIAGSHHISVLDARSCLSCVSQPLLLPPLDRSFSEIWRRDEIAALNYMQSNGRFGEKTARLAMASLIAPDHTPEFIGIPFGVYFAHLAKTKMLKGLTLEEFIAGKVAECIAHPTEYLQVSANLLAVREAITQHGLAEDVLVEIVKHIEGLNGGLFGDLRLRTSNDIEDRLGAGIYESVFLPRAESLDRTQRIKQIEGAVLSVWASLYEFRAFQVRRASGISEGHTAMSILVHSSIQQQTATGVANFNRYYGNKSVSLVSRQGEHSVTSPDAEVPFDHIRVDDGHAGKDRLYVDGQHVVDPQKAELLIPYAHYKNLIDLFAKIHHGWPGAERYRKELVFEWVLQGTQPVILQVKEMKRVYDDAVVSTTPAVASGTSLQDILGELRNANYILLPEYLENIRVYGNENMPFYYVEISGERLFIFVADRNHLKSYYELQGFLQDKKLSFKFLDYGNLHLTLKHSAEKTSLGMIAFSNVRDNDAIVLQGNKDREGLALLKEMMRAFLIPAVDILSIERASYLVRDTRYFPDPGHADFLSSFIP